MQWRSLADIERGAEEILIEAAHFGTPSRSRAVHSANATNLSHPHGRRFICDGRCCLPTFIGITNQMKNIAVCIG